MAYGFYRRHPMAPSAPQDMFASTEVPEIPEVDPIESLLEQSLLETPPGEQAYRDLSIPNQEDYAPSKGRKILSVIAAALGGYTNDVGTGMKIGRTIQDSPYNNAIARYNEKSKALGAVAANEEKELGRKRLGWGSILDRKERKRAEEERNADKDAAALERTRVENERLADRDLDRQAREKAERDRAEDRDLQRTMMLSIAQMRGENQRKLRPIKVKRFNPETGKNEEVLIDAETREETVIGEAALSPAETKVERTAADTVNELTEARDILAKNPEISGPIQGRWNENIARPLGWTDKSSDRAYNILKKNRAVELHELLGAAMTKQELQVLGDSLANPNQADDVLLNTLDQALEKISRMRRTKPGAIPGAATRKTKSGNTYTREP